MGNHQWKIDGKPVSPASGAQIIWEDNQFFKLTYNGESFLGEITEEQLERGYLKVKINHREFTIQKEGPLDELIASLGLDKEKIKKLHQLRSPMPGRINGSNVKIGDEINLGDELLTLEAMKMENVLKSDGIGRVKTIHFSLQEVVDKNAILITFE